MALAEEILQLVQSTARREGAREVKAITLEIGALAALEVEALRFCFSSAARNSCAENAALDIREIPGEAWCLPCAARVPLPSLSAPCPRCGSYQLQAVAGTEMRVKEIEIV
ncbi:MAG: hydrogenase maturation nickel metallochaperone HypA [Zoogloeaceae bacterium]|jgi:hydrogenase nickel incorporation protein HypA/HybF|nr:hydrogenase maturation nickel metallochaperone HypA [Zoogloeaceae bacterium]